MNTQLSVSNLSVIIHASQRVITTELLARLYGTEINSIKVNHSRNQERFIEGKHFFKVVGEHLKNLRVTLSNSQNPVSPKTRSLILWTERGAARHAKMLETDQAWEVFEQLEDCYFNQKEKQQKPEFTGRIVVNFENGVVTNQMLLRDDEHIASMQTLLEMAERAGYLVIDAIKLSDMIKKCSFDKFSIAKK